MLRSKPSSRGNESSGAGSGRGRAGRGRKREIAQQAEEAGPATVGEPAPPPARDRAAAAPVNLPLVFRPRFVPGAATSAPALAPNPTGGDDGAAARDPPPPPRRAAEAARPHGSNRPIAPRPAAVPLPPTPTPIPATATNTTTSQAPALPVPRTHPARDEEVVAGPSRAPLPPTPAEVDSRWGLDDSEFHDVDEFQEEGERAVQVQPAAREPPRILQSGAGVEHARPAAYPPFSVPVCTEARTGKELLQCRLGAKSVESARKACGSTFVRSAETRDCARIGDVREFDPGWLLFFLSERTRAGRMS